MPTPPTHTADTAQSDQLPQMFHRYSARIGDALRSALSHDGVRVYDMLRYYMGWVDEDGNPWTATEGKALRPTLCLFACEANGGSLAQAMPAAVALEFIHNFSLIHDDIQDRDEMRHHRRTVWAVWGVPRAVVAGNVLRILADKALQSMVGEGVGVDRALDAVALLTEAYLEMIEGQYLDIYYEGRPDISTPDYLHMISRKTGALIRSALNIGAVIGTDDAVAAEAFRSCGSSLGYVFQIRDDVLGVWGDEKSTGKPVGADIRRKKNSFPVAYAMSHVQGRDKERLTDIYRIESLTDGDVATVLEILDRAEVREHAQRLAEHHRDKALKALGEVRLAPELRDELEGLAQFLLVRNH